jgi:UTP--glucose-1-phosphate uridylyltransferase
MFVKPSPGTTESDMAIIGRYILQPEIFSLLEETEPGYGGEIQLTDALLKLSRQRAMYAYEFEGTRFDAGDKLGYLKAIIAFGARHPDLGEEFKKYIKQVSADF